MIFKHFEDSTKKQISILKSLYQKSKSSAQKKLIEYDLKKLQNGHQSEKENAYYLDFHLGSSDNHILLHNIRLEHKGRTAQIDHILISRMGITLLESKSFKGRLSIKHDGSPSVAYGKHVTTFPNPIEQNNRHKIVINELINDYFDVPINAQIAGGINIYTKVLINPKTTIENKKLPDGYERADSFATARINEINKMSSLAVLKTAATMLTKRKMQELASFIVKHDKPISFDYRKKYIIPHAQKDNSYIQEDNLDYNKTDNTNNKWYRFALSAKAKTYKLIMANMAIILNV